MRDIGESSCCVIVASHSVSEVLYMCDSDES